MAAAAAAALLDELMGRDRNLAPNDKKKKELHWEDHQVCKHFLVMFCPNELFINTRADLGPCDKLHDESLKKEYETCSKYQRMGYEEDFIKFCQGMLSDVERRIRRGRQRLSLGAQEGGVPTPTQVKNNDEQIKILTERLNGLLEQVESLGCEGKVEEAQGIMKLCDQLKDERENLRKANENSHWFQTAEIAAAQEKQMEVCEVCGAFLIVGDAQQRVDDHLMGKQHVGYAKIKAALEEILDKRQKEKEEREKQREKEREERMNKRKEYDRQRDKDEAERRNSSSSAKKRRSEDDRSSSKRRSRSRSRDGGGSRRHHSRGRDHKKSRSRSRDRDRKRSRSRSRNRGHRRHGRDRSGRRSRSRSHGKEHRRGSGRRSHSRSRSRERRRSHDRKAEHRSSSDRKSSSRKSRDRDSSSAGKEEEDKREGRGRSDEGERKSGGDNHHRRHESDDDAKDGKGDESAGHSDQNCESDDRKSGDEKGTSRSSPGQANGDDSGTNNCEGDSEQ